MTAGIVTLAGAVFKIHVHPDVPEAVFTYAGRWGSIETTRAAGMRDGSPSRLGDS